MNTHEKVLSELRLGKYNLFWIEEKLNIPKTILSHAISGRRKIPTKYLELLINELKL